MAARGRAPGSGSPYPEGRGRVVEQVTGHEPGVGQTLAVEDPKLRGTQRVSFEPHADGVAVRSSSTTSSRSRATRSPLVDLLFVRRAAARLAASAR